MAFRGYYRNQIFDPNGSVVSPICGQKRKETKNAQHLKINNILSCSNVIFAIWFYANFGQEVR